MFSLPSPLTRISHPLLDQHRVTMYIKRDDLIHPEIAGNKWRKLKYNFEHALKKGYSKVVTFGGAFSNHIAATSVAAAHFNLRSIGIIRGDELDSHSNPTLQLASRHRMQLTFITRQCYRKYTSQLHLVAKQFPTAYIIPEGGTNALAIAGVSEIINEINQEFDCIITAVGTGGTMAGLIAGLGGEKKVLGMSILKGDFITSGFQKMLLSYRIYCTNHHMATTYHFGGYGKVSPFLIDFINKMKCELNVLFDPIYTGKAFFGVWEMIANGIFDDKTIVFLHTGGLQGIAGFNQKNIQKIHI